MKYTDTFLGHYDLNQEFIKDIRKLLRLSGFRLWVRGGNPNRKQHAGKTMPTLSGGVYRISHDALRAALPLKYSTYGRFYLRPAYIETFTTNAMGLNEAKGVVKAVVAIYKDNNINLKTNVPA